MLSYREECFDAIGLKSSLKVPLYNGSLECELRKYQMFSGRYNEVRSEGRQIKSEADRRQMAQKRRFKERRAFKQGLDESDEEFKARTERPRRFDREDRPRRADRDGRPRRFDGDERPRRFDRDGRNSGGFKKGGRDLKPRDYKKGNGR